MSVLVIGFAKLASDLYGIAVTRGTKARDAPPLRYIPTDVWKQQLLKQL